jgi:cytochrome c5
MIQKRLIWFTAFFVLVGLIAMALVACGSQQASTPVPASDQGSDQVQSSNETASMDGKTLMEERCTACHSLEKAQSGERDLAGWQAVVDDMIKKGAKLNQDEAKVVAEYLANLK